MNAMDIVRMFEEDSRARKRLAELSNCVPV